MLHKKWLASLLVGMVCGAAVAQSPTRPVTAAEAIKKILEATGVPPIPDTVDAIKAGDPDTPVTGIVTTFLDSYEVLEKAVAEHKNLIVTHEPTFYNHRDDHSLVGENDPVLKEKLAYIEAHHLVVWRFHDAWHARKPDGILEGEIASLGWKQYQSSSEPNLFVFPKTTVGALAESLRTKTGAPAVRVIGDPKLEVTHVALVPGAAGLERQVKALEKDNVEVLVVGEAAEWETMEYARDASAQGRHKALIVVGHEATEEQGMKYCAEWLKGIFPGMPISFVKAGEPYWALGPASK